jgi:NHL repeat
MAPLVGLLVGAVVLIAGAPTAQAASYGPPVTIGSGFSGPYGVAVDVAGDVFVDDSAHNRVVEVPAGGGSQTTVGSGLSGPMGVAVDAAGDVFVADTSHDRVVEVPAAGGSQTTIGSGFSQPMGVAVDAAGDVFVVDTGHGRVVEVPVGGGSQTTIASGLSTPIGVAVDAAGDVFVPDSAHGAGGTGRVVEVPVVLLATTTDTVVGDVGTQSAWLGTETTGAAADDAATVTGASGVPSGTVTYSLYGNGGCSATATSTDQVTLSQDGSVPASSSSGALAAGSYGYQAAYSGDSNYQPLTGACEPFTVAQAPSPPVSKPANASPPWITGTATAGRTLSCLTGSWTNSPPTYAYAWSRDGTPLAGATGRTYTVQTLDQGSTLTCTVTASNAAGAGSPAISVSVTVPVPFQPGCPRATGRLAGHTLGLITLGMTRQQAHLAYSQSSTRGNRYKDFFCLTPIGVRVGYTSAKLLRTLDASQRHRMQDRVVLALTANPYYSMDGVRPGARLSAARQRLARGNLFHIGLNWWYLAFHGSSTAVLKIRHGIVQEIGMADRQLTKDRHAQFAFITSF